MVLPVSILVASIAVLLVLLVSFGYLYLSERKVFILSWFLAVFALIITYLARLPMLISGWDDNFIRIINYISTIVGYLLIYIGTRKFFGKQAQLLWSIAAVFLSGVFIFLLVLGYSPNLSIMSTVFYCSALLAVSGLTSISSQKLKGVIKYILGCSFFVWSTATFIYPFCRILKAISLDYGYITIGFSGLITLISLQSAYFVSIRDELTLKESKIKKLVMYDKLTGAYNRAYFEEVSGTFFDDLQLPAVLALGDINGLKLINDTFGHKQGDELLIDAVRVIKNSVNENNTIIRWGGDEFIVIMPQSSLDEAEQVVAGIKNNCRSFDSKTIPIDISIGLAKIEAHDCCIDDIIAQAEERMYSSKLNESRQTRRTIIEFLERLLWEKDYQTEEHVLRLKSLVLKIGSKIGLTPKEIDELSQVALLHDIGKIAVPAEILKKPGSLTAEEWEVMKKHSETGYRIAQSSGEFAHISEAILGHHEWWNGTGYPQGLKGEEIPLYSRIVTIVDSYDVITHDRPYKQAIDASEALNEIRKNAGIQYDPFLADVFIHVMQVNG